MEVWIPMMIACALFPAMMLTFGGIFRRRAPKEINALFGYRTTMSMKNADTWEFAHRTCGRVWWILGWCILPLSVIPMLCVIGQSEDVIGTVGLVVTMIDLTLLVVSIIPTEIALKKHFNPDGSKKEQ